MTSTQNFDKDIQAIESSSAKDDQKNNNNKSIKNVGLRCTFLSIGEIDTVNQNFTAQVFVEGQMKDPAFKDKNSESDIDERDKKTALYLHNKVDGDDPETWFTLHDGELSYRMKCTGKFSEKFELRYFPFDTQELNLWVSSFLTEESIELSPNREKKSLVATEYSYTLAEWDLWEHVITRKFRSNPKYSATGRRYPLFTFTVHVTRRWKFYFWNVMLPMFILVTMAGSALVVPVDDPATRLGIALSLVLTVVAFKFTISGYVPKIAYNTLLDVYNIFSFVFLSLFVLLIVIVPYMGDTAVMVLTVILCGSWLLGNVLFVVQVARYLNKTNSKMQALEKNLSAQQLPA